MDKNYNVDDILLDIKTKKMLRAGGQPPPAGGDEKFPAGNLNGRNGVAFAPTEKIQKVVHEDTVADEVLRELREKSVPAAPRPESTPPKKQQSPVLPAPDRETYPFQTIRVEQPAPQKKRQPLDFESPVRPLADRAKQRRKKRGESGGIDLSRFAVSESEKTEGLPHLGPSRELNLDEIREIDFSGGDYPEDDSGYYEDETDSGVPRPAVDFSEYNSIEDRRDVAVDIAQTKLWLVIRTFVTLLLSSGLFYLLLAGGMNLPIPELIDPAEHIYLYLGAVAGLTVFVALAGSSPMGGGLISFFKLRANSDSLVALAMLGAVGQSIMALLNPNYVNLASLTLYSGVACLSMLFNAIGKLRMISRIQANFRIISSDKSKKAVLISEDDEFSEEYLHGPARRSAVVYSAKCEFLTDFLALSYSDKYDVGINRAVAPVCLLGALVVGALTYLLTGGNMMSAITALTAILCVAATFSATFVENVPLAKLTKKLAPIGGMVSGNKAVEDFCDISAVVLDERDLFPYEQLKIFGIKDYSGGRVDEVILDAASVLYDVESCFSGLFLQMIGGNKKLLRRVDSAAFEDGLGITAMVDGRQIRLGSRKFMHAAGIELPKPGYEQKYAQLGGLPIFLASGKKLCAQIIVGYKVDEPLAVELDKLAAARKLLIVRTVDANLTADKIWELYGYPVSLIRIMPARQHALYKKMTAPRPSELAEMAYTGRVASMISSLTACAAARSSILSATIVQLLQISLGYALVAMLAFMNSMSTLSIVVLAGYQLFWFIVISIIQKMRSA